MPGDNQLNDFNKADASPMELPLSRRSLLAATVGAPLLLPRGAAAAPHRQPVGDLPDLKTLLRSPLLNRERATDVMQEAGLEALVLSNPVNVYYATNRIPAVERTQPEGPSIAVVPRDPKSPVFYIGSLFEYYYIVADYGLAPGVEPILTEPALATAPGYRSMFRDLGQVPLTAGEVQRREVTTLVRERRASAVEALKQALVGIHAGSVGVDDYAMAGLLAAAAPNLASRPAEDLMRRIRLVKTPAEIGLMRAASNANVGAALATARAAREAGSLRELRARFFTEAARRGSTGVFMVADGTLAESVDRRFNDGDMLMIDCVSQCGGYFGDYARTVFFGEPRRGMRRVTDALAAGWDEVRHSLRPGMKFSQIHELGTSTLKKLGYDYTVAFGPHSVGLYHTDQPRLAINGEREDITLMEGMIISVDCPLMDTGVGGTAHLEDLTLITAAGPVPIHPTGDRIVIV